MDAPSDPRPAWTSSPIGRATGIGGSSQFEREAVCLDHHEGITLFAYMSCNEFDVWAVDVPGLLIEKHEGWLIHEEPVSPERPLLIQQDLPANPHLHT